VTAWWNHAGLALHGGTVKKFGQPDHVGNAGEGTTALAASSGVGELSQLGIATDDPSAAAADGHEIEHATRLRQLRDTFRGRRHGRTATR